MLENKLRDIFKNKNNYYNIIFIIFLAIILFFLSNNFNNKFSSLDNNNLKIDNESNSVVSEQYSNFINNSYDISYEKQLEDRLKTTLALVEGVGNVDVMININTGKELITKSDYITENSITTENSLAGDTRSIQSDKSQDNTVKINGDEPLILKEISPQIEGVLIVAQGGDNIEIKNALINATNALLGVEVHKIQVLKMK